MQKPNVSRGGNPCLKKNGGVNVTRMGRVGRVTRVEDGPTVRHCGVCPTWTLADAGILVNENGETRVRSHPAARGECPWEGACRHQTVK